MAEGSKTSEPQTVDQLVSALARKVGEKAEEDFKKEAYTKITNILLNVPPPISSASPAQPVQTQPPSAQPVVTASQMPQSSQLQQPVKTPDAATLKVQELYAKKNEKPRKPEYVYDKKATGIVVGVIIVSVAALLLFGGLFGGASAQAAPSLTITPNDSNIIQVNGFGFNASENVRLMLSTNDTLAYSFPNTTYTSVTGNFSVILIIPTSISGDYIFTAATDIISAQENIHVPNLYGPIGPQGIQGPDFNATGNIMLYNGTQGEKGDQGAIGVMGNSTAGIIGIAISVVALIIVILPRKKN